MNSTKIKVIIIRFRIPFSLKENSILTNRQDLSNNLNNNSNNSYLSSLLEEKQIETKHKNNRSMMNSTGYIYKIKPSSLNKSKGLKN
jgi:hypothetical protein